MFAENVAVRVRRPMSPVVTASLLFHLGLAVVFWIQAAWKLDRLSPSEPPVFALAGLPPLPAAPAAAPAPIASKASTPQKRTSETLQPSREPAAPTPGGPVVAADPGVETTPDGTCSEDCVRSPIGPGIGEGVPDGVPDVPPPPAPVKPATVQPDLMEGQRIAGEDQLLLPGGVLAGLSAQGIDRVRVSAKVCIDTAGDVDGITITGTPPSDEVAAVVRAGISRWRFQPYRVAGSPVPACFVKVFNYTIAD